MGAVKLVNVVLSGLANEVQYIREQRDLTLEVVCDQLGWQQSKLSRMENGQQCISTADLASILVIYGVRGKERQRLLHLVDRQDEPGYWEFDVPVDEESRTLMRLESGTTAIVAAEPLLIPGLAQIADYTSAVMKGENAPPELVGPRVEARKLRQRVLTSAAAPKLTMIVNEAALRQVIGSHKIMAAQLRALLEVADLPNVRLWVLPFEVAGNAGLNSPFYLMNFRRNMSVVYLESATSNVYLEDASKIDFFRRQASELVKAALDPAASAGFVAKIGAPRRRSVVSPVQPGRTERKFLGLMTYPEPKGARGRQHVRKPAVVFRCGSNALRGPRDMVKS